MKVYYDDWEESGTPGYTEGRDAMIRDFELTAEQVAAIGEVIFAGYTYENYSGSAFVLYVDADNGKLYEVNGGHCSCHGLEDQWEPEETSAAAVRMRAESQHWGVEHERRADVEAALAAWEARQ